MFTSENMWVGFDARGQYSVNIARNVSLKFQCFLQTSSFSMLICGLKSCRLLVGYCDVYEEYLYTTTNVGP